MKRIRILTISLVVVLVAGASIFYACEKDERSKNIVNNLKKEMEFVAKNSDGTCVQVEVFRDENNNAVFVTKNVPSDPEVAVALIISDALKIEPQQTKNDEELVFEIPNDAIYWLVSLEGYEPIKFAPVVSDAKTNYGPTSASINCVCWESKPGKALPPNSHCEKENQKDKGWFCKPKKDGNCGECYTIVIAKTASTTTAMLGSVVLVQSPTVTVNSITYR